MNDSLFLLIASDLEQICNIIFVYFKAKEISMAELDQDFVEPDSLWNQLSMQQQFLVVVLNS